VTSVQEVVPVSENDNKWTCPHCGSEEPHSELEINEELTADVTCLSVYLEHDDNWATVLTHEEFERLVGHYQQSIETISEWHSDKNSD
jgi:hypothetical protein